MIDKTITYRLIGAGIMVLSAAIVLPLILDGERPAELDMDVQVSTPPEFPVVKIQSVQPLKNASDEKTITKEKTPQEITLIPTPKKGKDVDVTEPKSVEKKAESKTVAAAPAKQTSTQKTPEKTADRWTVQIATFKSRDNATRLVEKLKKDNYDAYSTTTSTLFKVYVGPEFKRETAEKMRDEIKKKFNLAGIVIRFSVN